MDERSRLRLINLTALLDSPVEGERINALSATNRLLEKSGLRWRDINKTLGAEPVIYRSYTPPPRRDPPPKPEPDRDEIGDAKAEALMSWLTSLVTREGVRVSAWEADFCNDIYDRLEASLGRTRITPKQWEVIDRIKKKNGDA